MHKYSSYKANINILTSKGNDLARWAAVRKVTVGVAVQRVVCSDQRVVGAGENDLLCCVCHFFWSVERGSEEKWFLMGSPLSCIIISCLSQLQCASFLKLIACHFLTFKLNSGVCYRGLLPSSSTYQFVHSVKGQNCRIIYQNFLWNLSVHQ